MNDDIEKKYEAKLPVEELAAFLREIADHLDRKVLKLGKESIGLDQLERFKINWKYKAKNREVKVKIKTGAALPQRENVSFVISPETPDEPAEPAIHAPRGPEKARESRLPAYKNLKKNMEQTFSRIRKKLAEGLLPGKIEMEEFAKNCDTMTQYPGKGDEYYGAFLEAVQSLEEAINRQSVPNAISAANRLKQMERECHRRYK